MAGVTGIQVLYTCNCLSLCQVLTLYSAMYIFYFAQCACTVIIYNLGLDLITIIVDVQLFVSATCVAVSCKGID